MINGAANRAADAVEGTSCTCWKRGGSRVDGGPGKWGECSRDNGLDQVSRQTKAGVIGTVESLLWKQERVRVESGGVSGTGSSWWVPACLPTFLPSRYTGAKLPGHLYFYVRKREVSLR